MNTVVARFSLIERGTKSNQTCVSDNYKDVKIYILANDAWNHKLKNSKGECRSLFSFLKYVQS